MCVHLTLRFRAILNFWVEFGSQLFEMQRERVYLNTLGMPVTAPPLP